LPPTRPTLVEVGEIEAPSVGAERRLPGGATLVERRLDRSVAELHIAGEVDAYDRCVVIDACTALTLEGARHLRIDAARVEFADLRMLEALARVAVHCDRIGGSFELTGLREPFWSMWADMAPASAVPAPVRPARPDDRVVALHGSASPEASRTPVASTQPPTSAVAPMLRVVADLGADAARAASRPA
jgi:hypothetical protein